MEVVGHADTKLAENNTINSQLLKTIKVNINVNVADIVVRANKLTSCQLTSQPHHPPPKDSTAALT